jgi:hypothetical protein
MLTSRLLLSGAALAAALSAQAPPCFSANDANTSVSTSITASPFVGLNPNSRAYQFSPTTSIAPLSASIFTGSPLRDDYMRLEIWDEDTSTNLPGNRIAVGTFSSPLSPTANWLGTNFDTAPQLNAGTNYWLVWIDSGGSIIPEEPGGVSLPRTTRASNRPWGTVAAGALKFRLYCNLFDTQVRASVGAPCATATNQLPTAFTNDTPTAGNTAFGIEGTNLPAGSTAWLLIGVNPNAGSTPLGAAFPPGCSLHTDIIAAIQGSTGIAEIGDQPSTPRPSPFGHVRFPTPLTTLTTSGIFFSAQLVALDGAASAPVPLVLSNALGIITL